MESDAAGEIISEKYTWKGKEKVARLLSAKAPIVSLGFL